MYRHVQVCLYQEINLYHLDLIPHLQRQFAVPSNMIFEFVSFTKGSNWGHAGCYMVGLFKLCHICDHSQQKFKKGTLVCPKHKCENYSVL
jgi:hypothetical protein